MVLAAGAGSRYGGLKQLAPIGPRGEALLEYSVFDALRAGFSRVVLVVRPETEAEFRRRFADGLARRVPLAYAHQRLEDLPRGSVLPSDRTRPWGTGHAVLSAEPEVAAPFGVINADDFYGAGSFTDLSRFLQRAPADASADAAMALAMIGFELAGTLTDSGPVSRALCRLDDTGHLREIVEIKKVWRASGRIVYESFDGTEQTLRGDELVSMNMWGFPSRIFADLRHGFRDFLNRSGKDADAEFLLPELIESLLNETATRVEVLTGTRRWCGITFREDDAQTAAVLSELTAQGHYPQVLWA